MSSSPTTLTVHLVAPRKRTSSFSFPSHTSSHPCPRPAKAPRIGTRMGTLRRTESFITLCELPTPTSSAPTSPSPPPTLRPDPSSALPYYRTLRHYKEQRERRKAMLNRTLEPVTIRTVAQRPTARHHLPQSSKTSAPLPPPLTPIPQIPSVPRKSSPLAPTRTLLPGRPVFPRSRPEPDLYRKAITTCMKSSPEGQKILRMGPRLAVSIMAATQELERIVAARTESDKDIPDVPDVPDAADATAPVLTKSWVVVPVEDWEMVDCGA